MDGQGEGVDSLQLAVWMSRVVVNLWIRAVLARGKGKKNDFLRCDGRHVEVASRGEINNLHTAKKIFLLSIFVLFYSKNIWTLLNQFTFTWFFFINNNNIFINIK